MATVIPYRQHDPAAVTMEKTGSTLMPARARSELAAMEGIADLLARLPDAAAREPRPRLGGCHLSSGRAGTLSDARRDGASRRVASISGFGRVVTISGFEGGPPEDGYLSVGGLEDWFDKDSTQPPDDRLAEAVSTQPVVSMIHGFVADFQKLARDWQED